MKPRMATTAAPPHEIAEKILLSRIRKTNSGVNQSGSSHIIMTIAKFIVPHATNARPYAPTPLLRYLGHGLRRTHNPYCLWTPYEHPSVDIGVTMRPHHCITLCLSCWCCITRVRTE